MGKTIQIRKTDTLKKIDILQSEYGLSTATAAIDLAVNEHMSMEEQIFTLRSELREKREQLHRIKTVIKELKQADENFRLLSDEDYLK